MLLNLQIRCHNMFFVSTLDPISKKHDQMPIMLCGSYNFMCCLLVRFLQWNSLTLVTTIAFCKKKSLCGMMQSRICCLCCKRFKIELVFVFGSVDKKWFLYILISWTSEAILYWDLKRLCLNSLCSCIWKYDDNGITLLIFEEIVSYSLLSSKTLCRLAVFRKKKGKLVGT